MGRSVFRCYILAVLMGTTAVPAFAQESGTTAAPIKAATVLSAAELQKLVAPVALYPDTVLIQILIGATVPLDVVKADRLLTDNAESPAPDLQQRIKNAAFDPSVEVLAIGFPTLIREMAVNIDWTETIGLAMLAQSEDVLAAVQVMRAQAINTGALVTSPQMVVSQDPVTSTVIVQPANPQVVYIPDYQPSVVYADPVGSAVAAGLVFFGTVALIDEIFDEDDHWNDYWGCRNCGGWDNGPIIRNPDIDINVDGNVNIGNDVNVAWKPDNDKVVASRNKIAAKRGPDGATQLGLDRPASRSDELRTKLGAGTVRDGTPTGADRTNIDRPAAAALTDRTPNAKPVKPAKTKAKPTTKPKVASKPARTAKPKVAKTSTARSTRAASSRGRVSSSKIRR